MTYREQRHKVQPKEPNNRIDQGVQIPLDRPPQALPLAASSPRPTQRAARSAEAGRSDRAGHLDGILNGLCQLGRVGALDGLDGRAVLEDHEGRHGAHAVLRGDVAQLVDVDLGKGDALGLRVLGGEGFEGRRDHLAGPAPVGVDCETRRGCVLAIVLEGGGGHWTQWGRRMGAYNQQPQWLTGAVCATRLRSQHVLPF